MKLAVNQDCCACSYCYRTCPVGAPYFDGEQTQIDTDKCIQCGKCMKACPMGAIYDVENPPAATLKHDLLKFNCDAVIVGAGASGMTAAVRLAEKGKKVIVLEKEKNTGSGAMHVAGPMQFVDTEWAKEAGEPLKAPQKIKDTIEYGKGYLDPVLIEKSINALPRFFDWLCTFSDARQGFELTKASQRPGPAPESEEMKESGEPEQEFAGAGSGMPGSAMSGNTGLIVEAKSYKPGSPLFHNSGEFIMKQLFRRADELGVQIRRQTRAEELLRNTDGTIYGVLAEDPGGKIEVDGAVCLIATGSLILGDAVKKVNPQFADCYQPRYGHTIKAYTGDGFDMCQKAGIPVRYEDIWVNITGSVVMPCDSLTVEYAEAANKRPMMPADLREHANRPESLMVNIRGERYQNEQMSNISVKNQLQQPKGLSYSIYTEELIKSQPYKWIPVMDENGRPLQAMIPTGMSAAPWNEEHMKWLDSLKGNHLIIADSIEELAERAGMDKGVLKATVDRYNTLCHQRKDTDFGKNSYYLCPIEKGPFYAVRTFIMSDGAEGGIPIDGECHVKGAEGPVSNLFAAGDNSSGNIAITPEKKKMWITNEFSWALSSGMIAADGMIAELEK